MRKIFQKGSFELVIEDHAGQEIIDLFTSTVMGTPERTRYQFSEVSTKMTAINNCYYLTLRKGERLLGTIGFVKRTTLIGVKACDSWYVRYFSIKAPLRSKEQWDKSKTMRQGSHFDNIFKSLASEYFDNPYLFLEDVSPSQKTLLYGYVEKNNIRSQQFTGIVGLESVREFCTVAISRMRLRMHEGVTRISDEEKPVVLEAVRDFYRGHTLFTTDNLFFNNNYLVCRHNSEIIAGLQANPETWRIIEIPGLNGWFLLNVLPHIPGIASFYKPDAFRFVAVEGLFYKEGYEDCLISLIESALAIHRVHFALTWLDTGSPVYNTLQAIGRFGIFSRFISRIPADVKLRLIGWDREDKQAFYARPAYLSCFDMT